MFRETTSVYPLPPQCSIPSLYLILENIEFENSYFPVEQHPVKHQMVPWEGQTLLSELCTTVEHTLTGTPD